MTEIMDGRALAKERRGALKVELAAFRGAHGVLPVLRILLVGDEQDSVLYARNLARWFVNLGLESALVSLPADSSPERVSAEVRRASDDPAVHGLLVQMPLPSHLAPLDVFAHLHPLKDVEGLHPENIGLLAAGRPRLVPSTPLAGMELLDSYAVPLAGADVVILGRSTVVGKPLAQLMLERDASVTLLHSRSKDVPAHLVRADVICAAAGRPNLVRGEHVKPGAVVVDFGINFAGEKIVGDVAYAEAAERASLITPVPGGVGPLTNVMLARNLLTAARLQAETA